MDNVFTSVDNALEALVPFVVDKKDPLWDSGLLFISKTGGESYKVELTGYYFLSEEHKENLKSYEKERNISFNPIHKTVFDYLQDHFTSINPKVKWDRLILEVGNDGRLTPHFEFEDDEVSPDAPPEPDTITAAYLCENLRNCLKHNAPANYQWLWEVIERRNEEDGKTGFSGKFYYSLFEDKTQPQKLEPGEYIYMYHVTARLFEEFLSEKSQGWTEVKLEFSRTGKVSYYILDRNA
jgi:hypothetical protein